MARRSTGQVVERQTRRGTAYALRFYAVGERRYETLGTDAEGWNRRRAEDELAAMMAAVRAGTWTPRVAPTAVADLGDPTFHEFASEWFEAHKPGWAERTVTDYRWALSHHLLPHFADYRLSEITVAEVDRYRAAKLAEGMLGPAEINKTLKRLSQILELAEEYGQIPRNPAVGRRRRVKVPKVRRSWVEPEQVLAPLEGASPYMRPVVATLVGAGLRVGRRWRWTGRT
jgi:integrase